MTGPAVPPARGSAPGTRFEYRCVPDLAPLAWVADVDRARGCARVIHGRWVEARSTFFVEGAWDGPFGEGGLARTDVVFGSGGALEGERIVFVSSASTTDALFYREDPERVVVSNSLPFLLAFTGDALDPHCTAYDRVNASIIKGIDGYESAVPTTRGSVRRLLHRNLMVGPRSTDEQGKPLPPPFTGYADYHDYLESAYGRLAANARDPARAIPLRILTTQSRGYDSTAINALARPFGIDAAFTVTRGKGAGHFATSDAAHEVDDDGTAVCEALGIRSIPLDRRSFETDFADEYLYYAALDANQDANLKDVRRHIDGPSLLLTGCLGETWYVERTLFRGRPLSGSFDLRRWDLGNHGLCEVRLDAGYVQVAVPFIGGRRRQDIIRITESPEMAPWRLGTDYDRPIPRRMAEEAGVPRELFGQKKAASVVEFPTPGVPVGAELRREFLAFLADHRLVPRGTVWLLPLVRRINTALHFSGPRRYRLVYYSERAVSRILGKPVTFPLLWKSLNGRIFCFCANRRASDYAAGLAARGLAQDGRDTPARPGRANDC